MAKEESLNLNIYQKLAKVRKQVEVIRKNKSGFGYKYVTEDEILAKVSVFMDKYNLSLIPGINPGTSQVNPYTYKKTKSTKNGTVYEEIVNEVLVEADMTYTWVNNDDPSQQIVVPWAMVGQQSDASQSFGSGLTYSNRYFLLKYFNIATSDDDPDSFRTKQKAAEAEADTLIAAAIVKEIDSVAKEFCANHPDQKDNLAALVKKYVKSGDYNKIKDSILAAKLLEDIKATFIKEE